uniref:Cyclin-dependent kinases regulatory subunit n=1 Tax=Panagrellus redivivus TaxID=6233 RepID=A0A7E4ZQ93_PANRE
MCIFFDRVTYFGYYKDDVYEYYFARIPKKSLENLPKNRLLSMEERISLGIKLPADWKHVMLYEREPDVLLFRRSIGSTSNENGDDNDEFDE